MVTRIQTAPNSNLVTKAKAPASSARGREHWIARSQLTRRVPNNQSREEERKTVPTTAEDPALVQLELQEQEAEDDGESHTTRVQRAPR